MIRENQLAYAASESFLLHWESGSSIVNVLGIAVLTTLLASQVISVFFDLLFGFKASGQAAVSDLNSLVLVQNPSPLATLSSISQNDFLTRMRFKLPIEPLLERNNDKKDMNKMSFRVGIKLLGLLLLAPIVNIISVIMALENESTISLRAAQFDGVAVGIANRPNSLMFDPLSENCEIAHMDLKQGEEPLSEFSICSVMNVLERPNLAGTASVVVVRAYQLIGFGLFLNGSGVHLGKVGFIRTEINGSQQSFQLPLKLDVEAMNRFTDLAIDLLATACAADPKTAVDMTRNFSYPGTKTKVLQAKSVKCEQAGDGLVSLARSLGGYLTFLESENMCLSEIGVVGAGSEEPHEMCVSGADFPLFVRRRRNVSLLCMAICVGCILVLYMFARVVSHNDVEKGVEVLMKEATELKSSDSGISDNGMYIDYSWRHSMDLVLV